MKTPSRVSRRTLSATSPGVDVLLGIQLVEVAADHAAYEVVLGHAVDRLAGDPGAVAQGGDPLADLEDLLQPVGDEQHGRALLAQGADDAEEPGHLAAGEGGGRLVHDQDAGVEGERLGDLDDLLVGDHHPCGRSRFKRARSAWEPTPTCLSAPATPVPYRSPSN